VNPDKLILLRSELDNLDKAAAYLATSLNRSGQLLGRTDLSPDELERLESMASRFARLAPQLLDVVPKVRIYAEDLARRFA
jgi:hypothetical protein